MSGKLQGLGFKIAEKLCLLTPSEKPCQEELECAKILLREMLVEEKTEEDPVCGGGRVGWASKSEIQAEERKRRRGRRILGSP